MSNPPVLHIVCFDIPYPADYGGAIDVFYRIKALSESGVKIYLHCTYKGELVHHAPLESLCEQVFYYPRNMHWTGMLHIMPFTVFSRRNDELLRNLQINDAPILFEGLVCCLYMSHPALANRRKFFRECNVEHDYYRGLAIAEHSWWKKLYFYIEAVKLQRFERVLRHANGIFALAHQDKVHFKNAFPQVTTYYVPCFQGNIQVEAIEGKGTYILYHGNLTVAENERAATYLAQCFGKQGKWQMIIAGKNPSERLYRVCQRYTNIRIVANPAESEMEALIRDAQLHVLVTFQATGLKLKLLHVLYSGRHVIVNSEMATGTELKQLCHTVHTEQEMQKQCDKWMERPFTAEEKQYRQYVLKQLFDTQHLSQHIQSIIFKQ
ncbi:MAG: glycosyltransferase family 1 protein [Paludibacteraceae bacterium]|nr:glycosyltransferase family 1 protein [Paludibacteraceae bacterium]